jgi:hypothetical protein
MRIQGDVGMHPSTSIMLIFHALFDVKNGSLSLHMNLLYYDVKTPKFFPRRRRRLTSPLPKILFTRLVKVFMLRRCEMHCEFESILDSILMCTTCRADESSSSVSCPPQVSKAGGVKKFFSLAPLAKLYPPLSKPWRRPCSTPQIYLQFSCLSTRNFDYARESTGCAKSGTDCTSVAA